jgi:nitroreductase
MIFFIQPLTTEFMDAITALTTRVSVPRLTDPAPDSNELEQIMAAALRAPDHGLLRPWRFLLFQQQARVQLGQIFANAIHQQQPHLEESALTRYHQLPFRAPLVIVAIACCQEHAKIPQLEQLLACGCAVNNMMIAVHSLGFGAMWRTGPLAYNPLVAEQLGLQAAEKIIAFLYIGTPNGPIKEVSKPAYQDFFSVADATTKQ